MIRCGVFQLLKAVAILLGGAALMLLCIGILALTERAR